MFDYNYTKKEQIMYNQIKDKQNLVCAFELTMRNLKIYKRERHLKNMDKIIYNAWNQLDNKQWDIQYREPFERNEGGKIRLIQPCSITDKIIQRAMLNILEPIFKRSMITECYQAIKERGMHKGVQKIKSYISLLLQNNKKQRIHYLQVDIKKYYENIDPVILKKVLKHFIKDDDVLMLFDVILKGDSSGRGAGVSIGDPISQWLGNIYLYRADHYFKSLKGIEYLRYADDMIFLSKSQKKLRAVRAMLDNYFSVWYNLELKPHKFGRITETNALDTLGYKFYINRVAVRKHIKIKLSKSIRKKKTKSIPSYLGHCKWANAVKMVKNIEEREYKKIMFEMGKRLENGDSPFSKSP